MWHMFMKNCILKNNDVIFLNKKYFWYYKRFFDIFLSILLFPILIIVMIVVLFFNLIFNKGSLFFIQKRMGKNCKPFYAMKFRTMKYSKTIDRKFSDPLEHDRITNFGKVLRKYRIDELPQILNVLKGEMSLIGPRPDYYEHALIFLDNVPLYKERHAIRPGISGLSQIRYGYVEGLSETKKKTKIDLYYIHNVSLSLEIKVFFGTLYTIIKGIN